MTDSSLKDFFRSSQHVHQETSQDAWHEFAVHCTQEVSRCLEVAGDRLSLMDVLTFIGRQRAAFAIDQQQATTDDNPFGKLRADLYSQSIKRAAENMQHSRETRARLDQAGARGIGFSLNLTATTVEATGPLLRRMRDNLQDSIESRSHIATSTLNSPFVAEVIDRAVSDRLSPLGLDTTNEYRRVTILEPGGKLSTTAYLPEQELLTYMVIEHPLPVTVAEFITSSVSSQFAGIIAPKSDHGADNRPDNHPHTTALTDIGSLAWSLFHAMPFIRGSGAVIMILTAALLQRSGQSPKSYEAERMDVDAMTLTRPLFVKKFASPYR